MSDLTDQARRTADDYDEEMRDGGTILRQLAAALDAATARADAAEARANRLRVAVEDLRFVAVQTGALTVEVFAQERLDADDRRAALASAQSPEGAT